MGLSPPISLRLGMFLLNVPFEFMTPVVLLVATSYFAFKIPKLRINLGFTLFDCASFRDPACFLK